MRELELHWIDAFTSEVFGGNPAAVVPLESWLDDGTLKAIAAENGLSETAFLVPAGDGYELRWFTPKVEVELCGHATLASGWVVMNELQPGAQRVTFQSRHSGALAVTRDGDRYVLDFPARPAERVALEPALAKALDREPAEVWRTKDTVMAVFETAADVEALWPNMELVNQLGGYAMVTAPGAGDIDFVSRFFAPGAGIPEDPVTGSAHTTLVPYWAERLGRPALRARQVSARGGDLWCVHRGARVDLAGHATRYLRGTIYV
jgi:PhzF family phenazine biosynthesis protein